MSIVTFWNQDKEQVGKTLSAVAVATQMSIQYNHKVLLLSTSFSDFTMKNCYWKDDNKKKLKLFEKGNNIAVSAGIEGLSKLIKSNKIQPDIITDYTKVIFKDRLEVLSGYFGSEENTEEQNFFEYEELSKYFAELITVANMYYDMVIVDMDSRLESTIKDEIKKISDLNIYVLSQRLSTIEKYRNMKLNDEELKTPKNITIIGKYNSNTKYNLKNILRYLGTKEKISVVPYNILFFEAAEEANVPDLFLKLRKISDTSDENYFFASETLNLTNLIIDKLKELQMKMR